MAVAQESSGGAATLVALTGNPNCGKTTLFNALTGLRAKVGNYAGVTVERKEGRMLGAPNVTVLDLPGTYSLTPQSLDEAISRDVLFKRLPEVAAPSVVVVVVDASNLERNLYYATQVIELGYPTVIALNMVDVAEMQGQQIDAEALSREIGTRVVPVVANIGKGIAELREAIQKPVKPKVPSFCELPQEIERELTEIQSRNKSSRAEALLQLPDPSVSIEARYARVGAIAREVTHDEGRSGEAFSDKLDRVLTHRVWGLLIFVAIMALMFESIFTLAQVPMSWIEAIVGKVGDFVASSMPAGDLRSLLVDGVIAGVGAVIVFLPQICLLFLFIGFLEDTGYMARAAFLMDRLMSKVGLHGKSFIPMLSSFACAIPGIMATRTIETPKDRLATILVAPLMSCSARLPVYTLLIAACIPDTKVLGFLNLQGLTMLAMYLLGLVVALLMAWLFKKTLLKGEPPLLIMELPPYKRPLLRVALRHMWDRSKLFLRRAGTVILGISIVLWFLVSYPRHTPSGANADTQSEAGEQLRNSFAGKAGHLIEPFIAPLGFDWKIGIGIIGSFAAREVFNSTMSTVYNVAQPDDEDAGIKILADKLREQRRPGGEVLYTPLLGVTLMVFYVFALQCVSTVAVVRRETNSWKWPIFQWAYMAALAWGFAFITYQGGRLLGF